MIAMPSANRQPRRERWANSDQKRAECQRDGSVEGSDPPRSVCVRGNCYRRGDGGELQSHRRTVVVRDDEMGGDATHLMELAASTLLAVIMLVQRLGGRSVPFGGRFSGRNLIGWLKVVAKAHAVRQAQERHQQDGERRTKHVKPREYRSNHN
jgi:hypothetical protein